MIIFLENIRWILEEDLTALPHTSVRFNKNVMRLQYVCDSFGYHCARLRMSLKFEEQIPEYPSPSTLHPSVRL